MLSFVVFLLSNVGIFESFLIGIPATVHEKSLIRKPILYPAFCR